MEDIPYAVIALILIVVGFAIWAAQRDEAKSSDLTPLGIILVLVGFGGAIAAFFLDITPGYDDDVVNIDAVGQRTMYFVAASAIFVAGTVLAAAGHVVDTLRPRAQPEEVAAQDG